MATRRRIFIAVTVLTVLLVLIFNRQLGPPVPQAPAYDLHLAAPEPELEFETDPHLLQILRSQGFPAQDGVGVRRERLDPLERYLFQIPATQRPEDLPEELTSKVHLLNPRQSYTVGERVQVRVDLYTGNGTPRRHGGDDVRIWLRDEVAKAKFSAVVARVTDLHNGSYLGDAVLKWAGTTLVQVSLANPREFLRHMSVLLHTFYNVHWNADFFQNEQGAKEKTVCATFAPIPGFSTWCNLTAENGGLSWYCAHPLKAGLNCSHHRFVTTNTPFMDLGDTSFSTVVKPFLKKLHAYSQIFSHNRTEVYRLIPNDIVLNVKKGVNSLPLPLTPCWQRPVADSWLPSHHAGWLDQGSWRSDACRMPDLTSERIQTCMRNTTLFLLGDSNQRLWGTVLRGLFPCKMLIDGQWHAPQFCKNVTLQATYMFAAHALPFRPGAHTDLVTKPLPHAMDMLLDNTPPGGKAVLVIHYFRHFMTMPVSVYRQRVREARRVLERLVQLHPNVTVIIRAPHSHYEIKGTNDAQGVVFYADVLREEFRGLEDKVWYLDFRDVTTVAENKLIHPDKPVCLEMLKMLFAHFCDAPL